MIEIDNKIVAAVGAELHSVLKELEMVEKRRAILERQRKLLDGMLTKTIKREPFDDEESAMLREFLIDKQPIEVSAKAVLECARTFFAKRPFRARNIAEAMDLVPSSENINRIGAQLSRLSREDKEIIRLDVGRYKLAGVQESFDL